MELILSTTSQSGDVLVASDLLSALIILDRNPSVDRLTVDVDTFPVEALLNSLNQRKFYGTLPDVRSVHLRMEQVSDSIQQRFAEVFTYGKVTA